MTRYALTRAAFGLLVTAGVLFAGCSPKDKAPAPPETPPVSAPAAPDPNVAMLQEFLPITTTYKALDGSFVHWEATREGDVIRVEETVGNNKTSYHSILQIEGSSLVQVKYGNSNGVEVDRQRTWLTFPLKPFTNQYSTEDAGVKEEVTEEWTKSEEFGELLHVHIIRTFGENRTLTVDEYYKSGVGLFSRKVTDKDGKVIDSLDLLAK